METILLPHLPHHPLHVCLFADLQNAPFLRRQLLDGNTAFEYAFLNVSVLLTRSQVLAACFRAVSDLLAERLKTRNVHSEIVFALSPNNNIAESFRRFGIQDDSKDIVAIKVGGDRAPIEKHLLANVQANAVALTDQALCARHDLARIRKVYRIEAPKKGVSDESHLRSSETFILGSMALNGS